VLTLLLAGELRLLFDHRILDEYAEVLARPRFSLDPADVADVLRQLEADGERIAASASRCSCQTWTTCVSRVALSGKADALVTATCATFRAPSASRWFAESVAAAS